MKRILLLRPGALGDLLLTVPAILALRARIREAHITLVGQPEGGRLLQECGIVEESVSQDDSRWLCLFAADGRVAADVRSPGEIDIAVGWLKDPDGTVAANLQRLGAKKIVIAPSAPDARTHVADHLLAALAPLGVRPQRSARYLLRPPEHADKWALEYLSQCDVAHTPVIAVHAGSGGIRKNWSATRFAGTIDILVARGVRVVLLCGPADATVTNAVLSAYGDPLPVARDLPLPRLAALLARCNAYLGNDSGVTHLAALVGVPTVALFGPTDPAVWGPRGDHVEILRWEGNQGEITPQKVAAVAMKRVVTVL